MEYEQPHSIEHEPEPSSAELANILMEFVGEEIAAELADMEFDDALSYAFTLLLEQGEDPEEILKHYGFLE